MVVIILQRYDFESTFLAMGCLALSSSRVSFHHLTKILSNQVMSYIFLWLLSFWAQNKLSAYQPIPIAQSLLFAVRTADTAAANNLWNQLAQLTAADLRQKLPTDAHKKAFWLNIYNAAVQHHLAQNPDLYTQRSYFYTTPIIAIAQQTLSLDDIEHRLLRHTKTKFCCFFNRFECQNRVETLDPRIHFALNCGATSCPPIAFYTPQNIDNELETATTAYLQAECQKLPDGTLLIPMLFRWFDTDFGGTIGISQFLARYGIIAHGQTPPIQYKPYDWSPNLHNYTSPMP